MNKPKPSSSEQPKLGPGAVAELQELHSTDATKAAHLFKRLLVYLEPAAIPSGALGGGGHGHPTSQHEPGRLAYLTVARAVHAMPPLAAEPHALKVLCRWLKPGCPAGLSNALLACTCLTLSLRSDSSWPLVLAEAYVNDTLEGHTGHRWSDHPDAKTLALNLRMSLGDETRNGNKSSDIEAFDGGSESSNGEHNSRMESSEEADPSSSKLPTGSLIMRRMFYATPAETNAADASPSPSKPPEARTISHRAVLSRLVGLVRKRCEALEAADTSAGGGGALALLRAWVHASADARNVACRHLERWLKSPALADRAAPLLAATVAALAGAAKARTTQGNDSSSLGNEDGMHGTGSGDSESTTDLPDAKADAEMDEDSVKHLLGMRLKPIHAQLWVDAALGTLNVVATASLVSVWAAKSTRFVATYPQPALVRVCKAALRLDLTQHAPSAAHTAAHGGSGTTASSHHGNSSGSSNTQMGALGSGIGRAVSSGASGERGAPSASAAAATTSSGGVLRALAKALFAPSGASVATVAETSAAFGSALREMIEEATAARSTGTGAMADSSSGGGDEKLASSLEAAMGAMYADDSLTTQLMATLQRLADAASFNLTAVSASGSGAASTDSFPDTLSKNVSCAAAREVSETCDDQFRHSCSSGLNALALASSLLPVAPPCILNCESPLPNGDGCAVAVSSDTSGNGLKTYVRAVHLCRHLLLLRVGQLRALSDHACVHPVDNGCGSIPSKLVPPLVQWAATLASSSETRAVFDLAAQRWCFNSGLTSSSGKLSETGAPSSGSSSSSSSNRSVVASTSDLVVSFTTALLRQLALLEPGLKTKSSMSTNIGHFVWGGTAVSTLTVLARWAGVGPRGGEGVETSLALIESLVERAARTGRRHAAVMAEHLTELSMDPATVAHAGDDFVTVVARLGILSIWRLASGDVPSQAKAFNDLLFASVVVAPPPIPSSNVTSNASTAQPCTAWNQGRWWRASRVSFVLASAPLAFDLTYPLLKQSSASSTNTNEMETTYSDNADTLQEPARMCKMAEISMQGWEDWVAWSWENAPTVRALMQMAIAGDSFMFPPRGVVLLSSVPVEALVPATVAQLIESDTALASREASWPNEPPSVEDVAVSAATAAGSEVAAKEAKNLSSIHLSKMAAPPSTSVRSSKNRPGSKRQRSSVPSDSESDDDRPLGELMARAHAKTPVATSRESKLVAAATSAKKKKRKRAKPESEGGSYRATSSQRPPVEGTRRSGRERKRRFDVAALLDSEEEEDNQFDEEQDETEMMGYDSENVEGKCAENEDMEINSEQSKSIKRTASSDQGNQIGRKSSVDEGRDEDEDWEASEGHRRANNRRTTKVSKGGVRGKGYTKKRDIISREKIAEVEIDLSNAQVMVSNWDGPARCPPPSVLVKTRGLSRTLGLGDTLRRVRHAKSLCFISAALTGQLVPKHEPPEAEDVNNEGTGGSSSEGSTCVLLAEKAAASSDAVMLQAAVDRARIEAASDWLASFLCRGRALGVAAAAGGGHNDDGSSSESEEEDSDKDVETTVSQRSTSSPPWFYDDACAAVARLPTRALAHLWLLSIRCASELTSGRSTDNAEYVDGRLGVFWHPFPTVAEWLPAKRSTQPLSNDPSAHYAAPESTLPVVTSSQALRISLPAVAADTSPVPSLQSRANAFRHTRPRSTSIVSDAPSLASPTSLRGAEESSSPSFRTSLGLAALRGVLTDRLRLRLGIDGTHDHDALPGAEDSVSPTAAKAATTVVIPLVLSEYGRSIRKVDRFTARSAADALAFLAKSGSQSGAQSWLSAIHLAAVLPQPISEADRSSNLPLGPNDLPPLAWATVTVSLARAVLSEPDLPTASRLLARTVDMAEVEDEGSGRVGVAGLAVMSVVAAMATERPEAAETLGLTTKGTDGAGETVTSSSEIRDSRGFTHDSNPSPRTRGVLSTPGMTGESSADSSSGDDAFLALISKHASAQFWQLESEYFPTSCWNSLSVATTSTSATSLSMLATGERARSVALHNAVRYYTTTTASSLPRAQRNLCTSSHLVLVDGWQAHAPLSLGACAKGSDNNIVVGHTIAAGLVALLYVGAYTGPSVVNSDAAKALAKVLLGTRHSQGPVLQPLSSAEFERITLNSTEGLATATGSSIQRTLPSSRGALHAPRWWSSYQRDVALELAACPWAPHLSEPAFAALLVEDMPRLLFLLHCAKPPSIAGTSQATSPVALTARTVLSRIDDALASAPSGSFTDACDSFLAPLLAVAGATSVANVGESDGWELFESVTVAAAALSRAMRSLAPAAAAASPFAQWASGFEKALNSTPAVPSAASASETPTTGVAAAWPLAPQWVLDIEAEPHVQLKDVPPWDGLVETAMALLAALDASVAGDAVLRLCSIFLNGVAARVGADLWGDANISTGCIGQNSDSGLGSNSSDSNRSNGSTFGDPVFEAADAIKVRTVRARAFDLVGATMYAAQSDGSDTNTLPFKVSKSCATTAPKASTNGVIANARSAIRDEVVQKCCAQLAWLIATLPLPCESNSDLSKDGNEDSGTDSSASCTQDKCDRCWNLVFMGQLSASAVEVLPGFRVSQAPLGASAREALLVAFGAALSPQAKAQGLDLLLNQQKHLDSKKTPGSILSGSAVSGTELKSLAVTGLDWLAWCLPRDEASPWPHDWAALKPLDEITWNKSAASLVNHGLTNGNDMVLGWALDLAPPLDALKQTEENASTGDALGEHIGDGDKDISSAAHLRNAWEARFWIVVRAVVGRVVLGKSMAGGSSRIVHSVEVLTELAGFCLEDDQIMSDNHDAENGDTYDNQIKRAVVNEAASARTLAARQLLWGLYLAAPKTVASLVPRSILATCLAAALPPPPPSWCAPSKAATEITNETLAVKSRNNNRGSRDKPSFPLVASGHELRGVSFDNAGKTLEKYAESVDDAIANWQARSDNNDDFEEESVASDNGNCEVGTLEVATDACRIPAATVAVRPVVNTEFKGMAAAVDALEAASTSRWHSGSKRDGPPSHGALLRFQEQRLRAVERAGRALRRLVESHPLEFLIFLPRVAALCWQDASTSSPAAAVSTTSLLQRFSSDTCTDSDKARGKSVSSEEVEPVVIGVTSMEVDDSTVPHSAGVCFNWENWGVCTRGARCRFYHDLTLAAPLGAYKGRDDRAAAINQQAAANADSSGHSIRLGPDGLAGAISPFTFLPAQLPRIINGGSGTLVGTTRCVVVPTLWGDAFQESLWVAAFDAISALPTSLLLLPVLHQNQRQSDSDGTFKADDGSTNAQDMSKASAEPSLPFAAGSLALLLAATARLGATQRALVASRESANMTMAALHQAIQQSEASSAGSALESSSSGRSTGLAASNPAPDAAGPFRLVSALPPLDGAVAASERVVAASFDLMSACRVERPNATARLLGDDKTAVDFGLPQGALGRALGALGISLETLAEEPGAVISTDFDLT